MASTYLYRTQVAGTSTQKMTFSAWVKRGELGSYTGLLNCYQSDASRNAIYFQPADTLAVYFKTSGSTHIYYETNRKFRDVNAWYHIVVRIDTTQGNASHRCRIYINGEEETSYSSSSGGSQNASFSCINQNNLDLEVGRMQYGSTVTAYYTGSMSHVHFIDGEDRTPDYFGSTDSSTGEWKIKTDVTGVTYGNNGFFILKDDNSNLDRSGEGHNQTIGGTLTKTEDNPSNVFATFNSLMHFRQPTPLLYGNTGIENGDAQWENGYGTIATPTTGKFYAEFKYPVFGGGSYGHAGIVAVDDITTQASGYLNFGDPSNSWSISVTDGSVYNSGSSIATYSSISANGIIGLAIDCTNSKLYISVNGTWQNSANPSAGTGGISITSNKEYFVGGKVYNAYLHANYGNGYFGTTAVSSAGTNASGIGIFEYDVPTGYTALSTKGLNL